VANIPQCIQKVIWVPQGESGNAFVLKLAWPTLSNNCYILKLRYPSGTTFTSIVDSAGNNYPTTPDVSATDTSNNIVHGKFHVFGGTAGAVSITVTCSASIATLSGSFQEWNNIATSSAIDGTAITTFNVGVGSKGTQQINSGAEYVPTTSGDLIFQECCDTGGGDFSGQTDGLISVTADPAFQLAQVCLIQGFFCQYLVQGVAAGVNPTALVTDLISNSGWTSITYGLKTASAGTAPSAGARCVGTYHYRFAGVTGGPALNYPLQVPTLGTTQMIGCSDPLGSTNLLGVSGAVAGPWTMRAAASGDAQFGYRTQSVPSAVEMLTINSSDPASHQYFQGIVWDWVGVGNFDAWAATQGTTSFGPGNTTPAAQITPVASSGVAIAIMGLDTGPPDSVVTPSGAVLLSGTYTGESDTSTMDNGDCFGHYVFSSNATQSWVFHDAGGPSAGYDAVIATFTLGPTITGNPSNQSASPGQSVSFTAAATASAGSLTYQWYRNGSSVSGATSATYTFAPNFPADYGANWYCLITDSNGANRTASAQVIFSLESNLTYVQPQQAAPIAPQFGNLQLNHYEFGEDDFPSDLNVKFWF
jgi:hypothetical protein